MHFAYLDPLRMKCLHKPTMSIGEVMICQPSLFLDLFNFQPNMALVHLPKLDWIETGLKQKMPITEVVKHQALMFLIFFISKGIWHLCIYHVYIFLRPYFCHMRPFCERAVSDLDP